MAASHFIILGHNIADVTRHVLWKGSISFNPVQTDATLLDVTYCVRLHTLLHVVAQSLKPVNLLSQQLSTFLLFRYRRSVAQLFQLFTHGLQSLKGCILPTITSRFQHWRELLHLFALHYQHERNNSQQCWPNNVESCCVRLHVALQIADKAYR